MRNSSGETILVLAKVTDDFLIGGSIKEIKRFYELISNKFKIGKTIINDKMNFNGAEITQDKYGNIKLSMEEYCKQVRYIQLSRLRRKETNALATPEEITAYKSLAGTINFLGQGVLPQAAFVTSAMQQKLGKLQVQHIREANTMVKELMKLNPTILYAKPTEKFKQAQVLTFSDAAFNVTKSNAYGQTGIINGMLFEYENGSHIFHILDWTSSKQRRVSHSSYGAEILACAEADDGGYYIKKAMNKMYDTNLIKHQLQVDSRGLYDTITTLHEGKEYRLRQTVQGIRDSFESEDLNIIRWIPGTLNVADALTKRNIKLYTTLNAICIQSSLNVDMNTGYSLDSHTWK